MADKNITPTIEHRAMIADLRRCTFAVASFDKRFVNSMAAIMESGGMLTEKQAALIPTMHYRYRRQHGKSTPNYNPSIDPKAHRNTDTKIEAMRKLQEWNEASKR